MAQSVEKYLREGYRKFQLKVGGEPHVDIERIRAVRTFLDVNSCLDTSPSPSTSSTSSSTPASSSNSNSSISGGDSSGSMQNMPLLCDANTGWLQHEALQVVNGVKDLDVYIEQPCATYEENLAVRRKCPLPFVLDENIDDLGRYKHYFDMPIANFLYIIYLFTYYINMTCVQLFRYTV